MKRISYIIIILLFLGASCEKEEILPKTGFEVVTLSSGIDGCVYVFKKTNNKYLEITNLDDFVASPVIGNKYQIRYKLAVQQVSYCQMGAVIVIIELKEIE